MYFPTCVLRLFGGLADLWPFSQSRYMVQPNSKKVWKKSMMLQLLQLLRHPTRCLRNLNPMNRLRTSILS